MPELEMKLCGNILHKKYLKYLLHIILRKDKISYYTITSLSRFSYIAVIEIGVKKKAYFFINSMKNAYKNQDGNRKKKKIEKITQVKQTSVTDPVAESEF